MSKYIVIHNGSTIKHIEPNGHDFTVEDVLVVDNIPVAEQLEGKYPVLVWSEELGLHYDYYDIPSDPEISSTEALNIITGGGDNDEE